jgi:hypothetical protein
LPDACGQHGIQFCGAGLQFRGHRGSFSLTFFYIQPIAFSRISYGLALGRTHGLLMLLPGPRRSLRFHPQRLLSLSLTARLLALQLGP